MPVLCVEHVSRDLFSFFSPDWDSCTFLLRHEISEKDFTEFDSVICSDSNQIVSLCDSPIFDVKILYDLLGQRTDSFLDLVPEDDIYRHLSKKLDAHLKSFQVVSVDTSCFDFRFLFVDQDFLNQLFKRKSQLLIDLFEKAKQQDILDFYAEFFKFVRILYGKICNKELTIQDKQLDSWINFNATGSKDGRLSCRRGFLNIFSLPKEQRKFILSSSGYRFVQFDFKSFQPRIAIFSTNDESFKRRFSSVNDIYSTGLLSRADQKLNFFRVMFGVEPSNDSSLKPIFDLRTSIFKEATKKGKIKNLFGRMIWYNGEEENVVFRNWIASCEADFVFRVVVKLNDLLNGLRSRIKFPFHDALIFEIHEQEIFLLKQIKHVMEDSFIDSIFFTRFPVKIQFGENFGELHDLSARESVTQ